MMATRAGTHTYTHTQEYNAPAERGVRRAGVGVGVLVVSGGGYYHLASDIEL